VHNVKASNWPTHEIQNDSTNKPRNLEQELDEEQTRNKSYVHKCGTYVNWFQQDLWPPIMATIKKYHASRTDALHFLKIVYRKPGCPSPYEKLGRTNLSYDWFTNKRKIKTKYVHVIELSTRVEIRKQNLPILEIIQY
jgi:hypothetical protein